MQRVIQITADGSHTLSIPEMEVMYHSKHGSLQESDHVFIRPGLLPLLANTDIQDPAILEIGFGTGLNALLTWKAAREHNKFVRYTGIEAYPLSIAEASHINFGKLLMMQNEFDELHRCDWETEIHPDPLFSFQKLKIKLQELSIQQQFHCIYFDAFAPAAQPELWTTEIFEKLFALLHPDGALLTYCSKSIVRQAMTVAGFVVEKIPGPPGKREIVRAWRK